MLTLFWILLVRKKLAPNVFIKTYKLIRNHHPNWLSSLLKVLTLVRVRYIHLQELTMNLVIVTVSIYEINQQKVKIRTPARSQSTSIKTLTVTVMKKWKRKMKNLQILMNEKKMFVLNSEEVLLFFINKLIYVDKAIA